METQPCEKNCPNRKIGCHGKCEKYLEWTAKRNRYLEKRYTEVKEDGAYKSKIFNMARVKR